VVRAADGVSELPPDAEQARSPDGAPLRPFLRYFVGLGTWGFGGPIATVGYMQRDLVEQRKWVTERDFLNGVALGQTMPGPLAAQVVMWVGFLQRGAIGALGTSTLFILPSFVLVLCVAIVYVQFQGLAVVQALFYGIAPAVIALIAVAAVKLARLTDKADPKLWAISVLVAVVTAATGAEIGLMFIASGVLMILLEAPPRWIRWRGRSDGERGEASARSMALLASSTSFKLLTGTATAGTLVALGLFFLKAGAFIFGSGLAVVPFLQSGVVDQHHWLTQQQFLDAVAMGLITPGPVVITATFIGYLIGGIAGALVATVAIFIPIYLGVVIPGRWFVRHREHPQLKAFVRGATAAAAGAIAGATFVLAKGAIVDWQTALIALGGLAFVLRFKNREPILVLLAAAAGVLVKGI
jgi:chromate transporter